MSQFEDINKIKFKLHSVKHKRFFLGAFLVLSEYDSVPTEFKKLI